MISNKQERNRTYVYFRTIGVEFGISNYMYINNSSHFFITTFTRIHAFVEIRVDIQKRVVIIYAVRYSCN